MYEIQLLLCCICIGHARGFILILFLFLNYVVACFHFSLKAIVCKTKRVYTMCKCMQVSAMYIELGSAISK